MSKLIFASSFVALGAALVLVPAGCSDGQGTYAGDDPSTKLGRVSQALDASDDADASSVDAGPGVAPKRGELVISAVYGGGGSTGATFKNDYVEIFNRTRATISLDGTSLQYAAGGSDFGGAGNILALSGTVPAGGYFLVSLAGAAAVGADLPTPDQSGTIILGLNDGKVAIAPTTAALACGAVARCDGLAAAARPVDMVGYGASTDWEGATKVPALDATKAAVRKAGGCTDADNNGADFTVGVPTAPKNLATTPAPCPVPTTPRPDASVPPPPIVDPPLGDEDPFDSGVRRDAGRTAPGAGASDDCAVSAPGHTNASPLHGMAITGILLGLTAVLGLRSRKTRRNRK